MNGKQPDTALDIETLVRARYALIILETYEEDRAIAMLGEIAERTGRLLVTWSVTQGLRTIDDEPYADEGSRDLLNAFNAIEAKKDSLIAVFKDTHNIITEQNPMVVRRVRDLASSLKYGSDEHIKTVILLSPVVRIPADLQKSVSVITLPFPNKGDIDKVLSNLLISQERNAKTDADKETIKEIDKELSENGNRDTILKACLGLTLNESEDVLAKSIVSTHKIHPAVIIQEKEQIIKKTGILEFFRQEENLGTVGGMDALKSWIQKAKMRNSKEAEKFGLRLPKGILLIGYAGTGKTLSSKVIASELGVPLLRMDMSSISSKWYGETSSKLKQGLNQAKAVSPCVLLLDEIEKMFSTGDGGSQAQGHEETLRAMSVLLTEMEENTEPVVFVATCNTPYNLKPELMQRFERIFFVGLPNQEERAEIIKIHIAKVKRNPDDFEIDKIVEATEGMVGREIRTIIQEALASAFYEQAKDVTTEHIVAEAKNLVPMSHQKQAEFGELRKWAENKCTMATSPLPAQVKKKPEKSRKLEMTG
ncbi:Cell division protein C [uncultured archaeon]|nr:Cell division protein C [uncultured archaeon]